MNKIIFFQPHPDDLDIFCPQLLYYLNKNSKYKYIIKIASMTKGEEGVIKKYAHYKGDKIAKIRTLELFKALKLYGINRINVHFFKMIDNKLRFNNKSVELIRDYLNKEKPKIIFAPEPIDTYYKHPDHIITGKIIYFICEKQLINKIPLLYFYTSINPNRYLPYKKEDFKLIYQLINIYKSQYNLYQQKIPLQKFLGILYGKTVKKFRYAEGYRKVFFGINKYKNKNLNFFQNLFKNINSRLSIPLSLSVLIGIILYI